MWEHLVSRWGYLAIALGTFVEGEAVLLSAGALAHLGLLSLPLVALSAALGSLVWGQMWFFLGRLHGRRFLERRPKFSRHARILERWVDRYGSWLVVAFRFITGAAIVLPVLIGASGFPRVRFLALDTLGALLWACVFAGAGFGLGAGMRVVLRRTIGLPEVALAALCGLGLLFLATRVVRAALARPSARRRSP
jgi:membrane protein DedA with SNARE-associated domain